jgi:hypothetical protein
MPINFIPNDPNTRAVMPMRQQPARRNRAAGRAGFNFVQHGAQALDDFGTTEFLFWQSREAALATVEAWEGYAGNLTSWADRSDEPRRIDLSPVFDDGQTFGPSRLNAYYDGTGVRFFDFDNGTETIFSGNSTDTVSHEVGHALLDATRPELFESNLPEVNAFHEAFGDCVAILTALADRPTREALLRANPDLSKPNFVETTSEYLAAAAKKQFGNVAPSKPRHGLNQFQWKLPTALPAGTFRDKPELLTREPHSFSRVVTGCVYDLLRSVFQAGAAQDQAALAAAAISVGRLLVAAAKATPETARYFQAVGRAMVKADDNRNAGVHRQRISDAFKGHGVLLGTAAMTAPTAGLAGPPPTFGGRGVTVAASTMTDVKARISAPRGRFVFSASPLGANVAEAVHRREVPLGDMSKSLKGVVAYGAEPVLIGASGGRAAVLGALPEPNRTVDEVSAFVETLLKNNRIALETGKKPRRAGAAATRSPTAGRNLPQPHTHVIRSVGGKKVLTRVRFLCR